MSHRPHTTDTVRHTRLFELIRQENMADSARFAATDRSAPDMAEMQNFLKQANRSLRPDEDGAA